MSNVYSVDFLLRASPAHMSAQFLLAERVWELLLCNVFCVSFAVTFLYVPGEIIRFCSWGAFLVQFFELLMLKWMAD